MHGRSPDLVADFGEEVDQRGARADGERCGRGDEQAAPAARRVVVVVECAANAQTAAETSTAARQASSAQNARPSISCCSTLLPGRPAAFGIDGDVLRREQVRGASSTAAPFRALARAARGCERTRSWRDPRSD